MTIWVCERCPGAPMFATRDDTEETLLFDVECHRVALHADVPGEAVWIEHDDWERCANDWSRCPGCKAPVHVHAATQTWACSDPLCVCSQSELPSGGFPLSTLQLVGP